MAIRIRATVIALLMSVPLLSICSCRNSNPEAKYVDNMSLIDNYVYGCGLSKDREIIYVIFARNEATPNTGPDTSAVSQAGDRSVTKKSGERRIQNTYQLTDDIQFTFNYSSFTPEELTFDGVAYDLRKGYVFLAEPGAQGAIIHQFDPADYTENADDLMQLMPEGRSNGYREASRTIAKTITPVKEYIWPE